MSLVLRLLVSALKSARSMHATSIYIEKRRRKVVLSST